MRTTISIDDGLGEDLKRRAASHRVSVSALIERLLREALHAPCETVTQSPFRLVTVGGAPAAGIDLDRASRLSDLEDETGALHKIGR